MAKSFENYEKETAGDKVKYWLKLVGIAFAGALVGALPYATLLCAMGVNSQAVMLLCGAGAVVFYIALGHGRLNRFGAHAVLVPTTLAATVITNFMCTLIHYAPQMADIETRPMSNLGKAVYIYTHARLDTFSKEGLITDGGTFSIYTILFASVFFAIVGIYVAMLLLWKWAKKEASGNPER
jgi:prolipoprotein diacylglyceryltransferase